MLHHLQLFTIPLLAIHLCNCLVSTLCLCKLNVSETSATGIGITFELARNYVAELGELLEHLLLSDVLFQVLHQNVCVFSVLESAPLLVGLQNDCLALQSCIIHFLDASVGLALRVEYQGAVALELVSALIEPHLCFLNLVIFCLEELVEVEVVESFLWQVANMH